MSFISSVRHGIIALDAPLYDATVAYGELSLAVVAVESTELRAGAPVVGYGVSPIGRHAPTDALTQRLLPRLRAIEAGELFEQDGTFDPRPARELLLAHEPSGADAGRDLAAATVEMALWDLAAKLDGRPLYRTLAERFAGGRDAVPVAVTAACGYYSLDPAHPPLAAEIAQLQDHGFRDFEVRVGGLELDDDLEPLARAAQRVGGANHLAVNAACGLDEDLAVAYAEALAERGLRWFAEPGDPLDYELFEELSDVYPAPLAAGGRLTSVAEVRNLLRYSALRPERDLLLLDPAALGVGALIDTLALLPEHGWRRSSVVAGAGVPLLALHVAAGLGLAGAVAAPTAFPPFGDLGPGVGIADGKATPPTAPGIGFEAHPALFGVLRRALDG